MCGIAGTLERGKRSLSSLKKSTAWLKQRGPDHQAHTQKPLGSFNLALLHTRFSIIDLNKRSNQPFSSADGSLTLIFNGEIYNYKALKEELEEKGHTFRTESDTEVILEAYRAWGTGCFEKFDGFWAIALADEKKGRLVLSRDRMGKAPFYYAPIQGGIAWASNMKGLFELVPELKKEVDAEVAKRYLIYAAKDVDEKTFWKGIYQLPKGSYAVIDFSKSTLGPLKITPYYELKQQKRAILCGRHEADDLVEEFWEIFKGAVQKRLVGDVPFAFEMSGGLDSSLIMAAALQILPSEKVHAYTVKFTEENQDEEPYARAIHEHYDKKFNYHVVRPDNTDILATLKENLEIMEEPIFSPGGSGGFTYRFLVKKIAEDGNRIVLSGSGGDELFGGYPEEFFYLTIADMLKAGMVERAKEELKLYSEKEIDIPEVLKKIDTIKNYNVPYQEKTRSYVTGGDSCSFNTDRYDFNGKIYHYYTESKVPYWLRAMDRSLMSIPIEGRYPFFDPALAEFAMKLPQSVFFRGGWPKWILRKAMEDRMPESVVWRKNKMGFPFPIKTWMAQNKATFVSYLEKMQDGEFFDAKRVIADYDAMTEEVVYGLWRLVNFSIWSQVFDPQRYSEKDYLLISS